MIDGNGFSLSQTRRSSFMIHCSNRKKEITCYATNGVVSSGQYSRDESCRNQWQLHFRQLASPPHPIASCGLLLGCIAALHCNAAWEHTGTAHSPSRSVALRWTGTRTWHGGCVLRPFQHGTGLNLSKYTGDRHSVPGNHARTWA